MFIYSKSLLCAFLCLRPQLRSPKGDKFSHGHSNGWHHIGRGEMAAVMVDMSMFNVGITKVNTVMVKVS